MGQHRIIVVNKADAEMAGRVEAPRDRLQSGIMSRLAGISINGGSVPRPPALTNLAFAGIEGETAAVALDLAGLAVSTGSACSVGVVEPSHVLIAMGLRREIARSCLHFSLGYHNSIRRTRSIGPPILWRKRWRGCAHDLLRRVRACRNAEVAFPGCRPIRQLGTQAMMRLYDEG